MQYMANVAKPGADLEISAGDARPTSLRQLRRLALEERSTVTLSQDTRASFLSVGIGRYGHVRISFRATDQPAASAAEQIRAYVQALPGRPAWPRKSLYSVQLGAAALLVLVFGVLLTLISVGRTDIAWRVDPLAGVIVVGQALWARRVNQNRAQLGIDPFSLEEIAQRPRLGHNWTRTSGIFTVLGFIAVVVFGVIALVRGS